MADETCGIAVDNICEELVKEARLNSRQIRKRFILKLIITQYVLGDEEYVLINTGGINIIDVSDFDPSKGEILEIDPRHGHSYMVSVKIRARYWMNLPILIMIVLLPRANHIHYYGSFT